MTSRADRTNRADRAYRCPECKHQWYYTKPICLECGSDVIETCDLDVGTVASVTVVHATPEGVRSPNQLALAHFDGVGVLAQVADSVDELAAGDGVRFAGDHVLRETDSDVVTGPRLMATRQRSR
jgi:uncharacterized OB-fold protein